MILPLDSQLEPTVNAAYWRLLQHDKSAQADERARCALDPWYWLVNWVYTIRKDEGVENEQGAAPERFPAYPYLQYVFHKMFTERLFAADKSRQLLLSILMMSYGVWKCQFQRHQEIVVQTKKAEDAHEQLIVKRAFEVWKNQPGWLQVPIVRNSDGLPPFCHMRFPPTDSVIKGIPKGADQIRSSNPTTVILDEGGFFEGEFEECRTAALACCQDVNCVSTANGGQWDDFINDKMVA
jgi:hypothetical protein